MLGPHDWNTGNGSAWNFISKSLTDAPPSTRNSTLVDCLRSNRIAAHHNLQPNAALW
jgi:hypothetical protein